jgi:hypothetical protein
MELREQIGLTVKHQETVQLAPTSIIIVNYNTKEKLLGCLSSVSQAIPPNCEVIVVDNASSDGSAEAVEADFPEVILIRSAKNLGFGAGNNTAVPKAQGRYLVFLNPDTLVERGWIEALLAPLEADSQIGLVTARILLADQRDRINACGNTIHLTGLSLCRGLGYPRDTFNVLEEVDSVSGAAFAIRRELLELLDGFDEDTFLYMEDTDLSWRARLAGWRCVYTPNSTVFHEYSLKITPLKIFYQERNRYVMLLKSLKWPTLLILFPAHLLAEMITWGFVLWSDRANLSNKVRAYRWIIANWSAIMQKRKRVQSLRRITDRELLRRTSYSLDFGQAGKGAVASLARFIFNPIFFVLRRITLIIVRW